MKFKTANIYSGIDVISFISKDNLPPVIKKVNVKKLKTFLNGEEYSSLGSLQRVSELKQRFGLTVAEGAVIDRMWNTAKI